MVVFFFSAHGVWVLGSSECSLVVSIRKSVFSSFSFSSSSSFSFSSFSCSTFFFSFSSSSSSSSSASSLFSFQIPLFVVTVRGAFSGLPPMVATHAFSCFVSMECLVNQESSMCKGFVFSCILNDEV